MIVQGLTQYVRFAILKHAKWFNAHYSMHWTTNKKLQTHAGTMDLGTCIEASHDCVNAKSWFFTDI